MKWMLVIMVFGLAPVKTELLYNDLGDCLLAEQKMRAEYATAYNVWNTWAEKNPVEAGFPNSREAMKKRFGLYNPATCIPHQAGK
jgi:hypothetical protein